MNRVAASFRRAVRGVCRAVAVFTGAVLLGQVGLLTYSAAQGIGGFERQIHWLAEVVEFCLLQVGFLGAAVALRHRAHQGIDALVLILPAGVQRWIERVNCVLLLGFGAAFGWLGVHYVEAMYARGGSLAVAPLPKWPFYLVFPLAGALLALFAAEQLLDSWASRPDDAGREEAA